MKTLYETVTFVLFVSVCLGIHLATGYMQSIKFELPPKKDWVTQPASYEEYVKDWQDVETYAKYQIVLAPEKIGTGVEFTGYESDEMSCDQPVIVELQFENQLQVVMDCHYCLESGKVFGGILRATQGKNSWQMSFLNIGAEGVLFSDSAPPKWTTDLADSIELKGASEILQNKFEAMRGTPAKESQSDQKMIAESIIGNLLYLMNDEFGERVASIKSHP